MRGTGSSSPRARTALASATVNAPSDRADDDGALDKRAKGIRTCAFGTKIPPNELQQTATLNFNILNTPDAEAAKSFYGAVFGWTTLDLGNGEFWTLSAYGDYLERLTPGIRGMTAEMGATGFEDVVAAIRPIDGEAPAHWGVQFSTDNTDSTAEKAKALGGEVVALPVDVP